MMFSILRRRQESSTFVLQQNLVFATSLIQSVRWHTAVFLQFTPLMVWTDIPITTLLSNPKAHIDLSVAGDQDNSAETYVVCRLGNDSQLAVTALRQEGMTGVLKDLVGGLKGWSKEVDSTFPVY